jgi:membrane-bound lytic murein transglycosylase A
MSINFQIFIQTKFFIKGVLFSVLILISSQNTLASAPPIVHSARQLKNTISYTIPSFTHSIETIPQGTLEEAFLHREKTLEALDQSIQFLATTDAQKAYRVWESTGITRERVRRSLFRLRNILLLSSSPYEFEKSIRREFVTLAPSGGNGDVRITGYFQPTYRASRTKHGSFQYPIYSFPYSMNSKEGEKLIQLPRVSLEGYDGKGNVLGPLKNPSVLGWLSNRFDVYMLQVQGSGILQLDTGKNIAVGFHRGTKFPFRGITKECSGTSNLSPIFLRTYFSQNPNALNRCMALNNRFVFFRFQRENEPIGSLGVPVIAESSIATDKHHMPPGAPALLTGKIPEASARGRLQRTSRMVCDHDSGSAIKGPKRVDLFMGTGTEAEKRASNVNTSGQLYYLVLKH